jgi:3-phosphoshikimate 1-carboxyvinyltransferase
MENGLKAYLETPLVSKPYINMTLDVLREFGIQVDVHNQTYKIKSGQSILAHDHKVEADASAAGYFMGIAAVTGGTITIENYKQTSSQGDWQIKEVFKKMGCMISETNSRLTLTAPDAIKGINVDMGDMPDCVQTLAVVALFADSPTIFTNISTLKFKETDRIEDTAAELRKFGAVVETTMDSLKIIPGDFPTHEITVETYDDHRMAMSFSIAALKLGNVKILEPECVTKSFPEYFDVLKEIYNS